MGMSIDDFCRCTPLEFSKIAEQWSMRQEALSRERWEQARFLAVVMLQPYTKKALKGTDITRFPWDEGKEAEGGVPKGTSSRELFEECLKRTGNG